MFSKYFEQIFFQPKHNNNIQNARKFSEKQIYILMLKNINKKKAGKKKKIPR
jgi:hypothetical protein